MGACQPHSLLLLRLPWLHSNIFNLYNTTLLDAATLRSLFVWQLLSILILASRSSQQNLTHNDKLRFSSVAAFGCTVPSR